MKSDSSKLFPLRREDELQDQSRCGVCEQLLTDPVSISCGHRFCRQCISSYWDQSSSSGGFGCPHCRKRSRTRPLLHPHKDMEEAMQHDCHTPVHDVLHRVLHTHKTSMKNKYESLFEGINTQENKTLLNQIYTQLYIIEGESESVDEEHEVLQMEKTLRKQLLQDIPINCSDIFKALRTVLTKGIAGIGKTVSVQKFILDWAEGKSNQDVDFMFVLPFRELNLIKDEQYSLHTLLCNFHPEIKDLALRTYDTHKCVFVFDGLDESTIPLNFLECENIFDITTISSVNVLITNLFKGELLSSALIWITSRPAGTSQIPPQYINRLTEIQGFTDAQKEEYFRKRIGDQDQAKKIILHIKRVKSLHIMCHIPVFCWISATVLQKIIKKNNDTEIPKTLTEMYIHFMWTQLHTKNYIKKQIKTESILTEKSNNLFLCLTEIHDQSLSREIQQYLQSDKESQSKLSPGLCSAIAFLMQMSEEVLDEVDLKKFNTSEEGYRRLIPAVYNCRKALLPICNLGEKTCENLGSSLQLTNSILRELDLTNNDLHDSGVTLLSAGLKSSHCKLEILRLSGCLVTGEGCSSLASALSLNPSHLKELDLTYNHPGDSGMKLLSAILEDPLCKLDTLKYVKL
uniref:RING-type domain-containing protein n=1 Tax=Electrophorus electricus TaxID=8005 RepID=A0AAY5EZX4_ELEEL